MKMNRKQRKHMLKESSVTCKFEDKGVERGWRELILRTAEGCVVDYLHLPIPFAAKSNRKNSIMHV